MPIDEGWWERAAEWEKEHPGQGLDWQQVMAAGPPPPQYEYLLQGRPWEPQTYAPAEWGQWRPDYTVEDLNRARYQDWLRANALTQEGFGRKLGTLGDYEAAIRDLWSTGRQDTRQGHDQAMDEWDRRLGQIEQTTQQTVKVGTKALDKTITNIQESLAGLTEGALGFAEDVWDRGAAALGEFRNEMSNMMTSWVTGHQEQTDQQKEQRAAELANQGYTPDEIARELRKIDMRSAQEQAGKVADFSVAEELNYRQLQVGYTQLGAQTETAMRNLVSQATQTAWTQEAALTNAKVELNKWAGSIQSTAQLGAAEAATQLTLNQTQYRIANNLMAAQGYGTYANLMQGLDQVFIPFGDLIAAGLATEMNLMSYNYGYEGGALAAEMGAIALVSGATNQAQTGLARLGA